MIPSRYSQSQFDKGMSQEQFTQVVDAILAGKYSWACVLILRFAGCNPLHYIPYRTYNRLIKENCQVGRDSKNQPAKINTDNQNNSNLSSQLTVARSAQGLNDLNYLEPAEEKRARLRGGNFPLLAACSKYLLSGIFAK